MDIGVVYPRFDCLGGSERFGLAMMREWSKEHDVTLYSLSIDASLLEKFHVDVKCVTCKTRVPFWKDNILPLMLAMKDLESQLGVHDCYLMNMFPANFINVRHSIWYPQEPARVLYDMYPELLARGDIPLYSKFFKRVYTPFIRFLDKRLNRAVRIVANSRYSAKYLSWVYGVGVSDVVYMGVDNVVNEPCNSRGDYILSVGRLVHAKRVDLAIRALKILPVDIKLKIVGEGECKNMLIGLVKDLGLENRVEFLGDKFGDELDNLYQRGICTVFTPIREPFGLVALESISQGTPVVGCNTGGFTEILSDGMDAYLIEPTPENIAKKIAALYYNKDLLHSMGSSGIEKSRSYLWSITADKLLNMLKDVSVSSH